MSDHHRWYARPVFFVADIQRAIRFYVDMLGFEKRWHEGDGAPLAQQGVARRLVEGVLNLNDREVQRVVLHRPGEAAETDTYAHA